MKFSPSILGEPIPPNFGLTSIFEVTQNHDAPCFGKDRAPGPPSKARRVDKRP